MNLLHFNEEFSTEDAYLIKNIDEEFTNDYFFIRSGVHRLQELGQRLGSSTDKLPNEAFSIV